MKFSEPWGVHRLAFLLEKAMSKEAKMWRGYMPKKPTSQDTDISPTQRDKAVCWLTELHGRLQLYPETLVLAVSILDRFLASIKARPKYLRCIAITSFFLAVKTCEEDECVPSLRELVASSSCGCSPSEIRRMEKIILDKLNWDLHHATSLDFLHIFHAMVLSCCSGLLDSLLGLNRSQHLALLTRRLYHCLADHSLTQLRGSMLALALITLDLETCCPDWLALTIELLRKAQIDTSELIRSRELVACSLSTPRASLPPNTVYIYQPLRSQTILQPPAQNPREGLTNSSTPAARAEEGQRQPANHGCPPALLSPPKALCHLNRLHKVILRCKASAKRKVEEMEVDDFYDDIKRLYNEDGVTATTGVVPEEVLGVEGSSSPCPPLQPVCGS
ncbi:cyclin-I [Corythoichthys intestinalis]|uniref:cyclin-I n=1 Tax=Corythoichthys intestinalis TaxID=161448 RepID=UPI0025A62A92|nr:cyclin-I [Corythoichthys intestinalis]XP_061800157.1 cyclin-I-like [Nerophis lumbriciformis]